MAIQQSPAQPMQPLTRAAEPQRIGWPLMGAWMLFSTFVVLLALARPGGWVSNQYVAAAERVGAGGDYYVSLDDGLPASTPYAPGGILLVQMLQGAGGSPQSIDFTLRMISAVSAVLLLVTLGFLSVEFGAGRQWAAACVLLLSIVLFQSWLDYAVHFKPDTLVLLFAVGSVCCLRRLSREQTSWPTWIAFIVLLVAGGLWKQQFVAVYFGLALAVLLTSMSRPRKVQLLATLTVSGLAVVLIMALMPNCLNNTVFMMGRHTWYTPRAVAGMIERSIKMYWPVWLALAAYVVRRLRESKPLADVELTWLCAAVCWSAFQLLSAVKTGGNLGNVSIALLPLLPFAVLGADSLVRIEARPQLVIAALLIVLPLTCYRCYTNLGAWRERDRAEARAVSFLQHRFTGARALYHSDYYMLLRRAGLRAETDVHVVQHFRWAEKDLRAVEQALERQEYDLVILPAAWCDMEAASVEGLSLANYVPWTTKENVGVIRDACLWVPRPGAAAIAPGGHSGP